MTRDREEGTALGADASGATLESDLRSLVGLRSRTAVRDRPLPALDALLPTGSLADPDARYAARTQFVDAAIEAMADAGHREAARRLLASGPERWRPLKARGGEAGAVFGCGWDAYRRRRTTGSSLLEETLEELARAARANGVEVTAVAPADGGGPPAPRVVIRPLDPTLVEPGPATGVGRSRRPTPSTVGAGLLGAVLLAVLLIVLAVAMTGRGDRETTTPAESDGGTGSDTVRCGALEYDLGHVPADADADLREWGERFTTYAATDATVPDACAGPVTRSGPNVIQLVSSGVSGTNGALLGNDPGDGPVVAALARSEILEYNRPSDPEGPEGGEPVWTLLGGLVEREDRPGAARMLRFETGALVTDVVESPTYAVTGRWFELWEEAGGIDGPLGRPVTDRLLDAGGGVLVQYFSGGQIAASIADAVPEVVVAPGDPLDRLPPDHRNTVLVEDLSTTAWFVDAEGVRHWIRDITSFGCARNIGVAVHRRQPPTAVAALAGGEAFTCP